MDVASLFQQRRHRLQRRSGRFARLSSYLTSLAWVLGVCAVLVPHEAVAGAHSFGGTGQEGQWPPAGSALTLSPASVHRRTVLDRKRSDSRGPGVAAVPEAESDSCILVAGFWGGSLVGLDPSKAERIRFRLALFPQVYADVPIDGRLASHLVSRLQFDPAAERVYISAGLNGHPFISWGPEGPPPAGFLGVYEWHSFRALWRIWSDTSVGYAVTKIEGDDTVYTVGAEELLGLDPDTGSVRRRFHYGARYSHANVFPLHPTGELLLVIHRSSDSEARFVTLDPSTLEATREVRVSLPSNDGIVDSASDIARGLIHLLMPSHWIIFDTRGEMQQDVSLPLAAFRWLFLPALDDALVITLGGVPTGPGSQLLALGRQGSLRTLWEANSWNESALGLAQNIDGASVLLSVATFFVHGGNGTKVLEVNPATAESRTLAEFGSYRDAGATLVVPKACPQARVPVGDCNADGTVTVDEVVYNVRTLLSGRHVLHCVAIDQDGNDIVTVDEIIASVQSILDS